MTKYFLHKGNLKTISTLNEEIVLSEGVIINGEKLTNGGHLPKTIVETEGEQYILKEDNATEFMLGTLYSKLLGEHSCTMKFSIDSDVYKSASKIVPNSITLKSFIEKHPEDVASIEGMEEVLSASFLMREHDFTNTNILIQHINGRNVAVKIDHEQSGAFLFDPSLTAEAQRDDLITTFIKLSNGYLRELKIDYSKFIESLKKYTKIFPEIVIETAQELEDLIVATQNDHISNIKSNADYVESVVIPYIESFEKEIYSLNLQDKMWQYYILPQDSIDLIVKYFSKNFTQEEKDAISGLKSGAIGFEVLELKEQGSNLNEVSINSANLQPKNDAVKATDAIFNKQFAVADELINTSEDLSNVIRELHSYCLYRIDKDKGAINFITNKAITLANKGDVFAISDVAYILQLHPGNMEMAKLFLGVEKIQNPVDSAVNSYYPLHLTILENLWQGEYETAKYIIQLAKEKLDILPNLKSVYDYVNKYSLKDNSNNGILKFLINKYPEEYASDSAIEHNLEQYLTIRTIKHDLLFLRDFCDPCYKFDFTALDSLHFDPHYKIALDSLHAIVDGSDISAYESLLGEESYDKLVQVMSQEI